MDDVRDDDTVEIARDDPEGTLMRVTRLSTEQHYLHRGLPALLRAAADWYEETEEQVREAGPVQVEWSEKSIAQALQVIALSYQDDGADGETLTIVWTT